MKIMITGGLGYIGSHLTLALALAGHEVVILDKPQPQTAWLRANLRYLVGNKIKVVLANMNDSKLLKKILSQAQIECVFHLAGLKSVPESLVQPQVYYQHNLQVSLNLVRFMVDLNIPYLVFSSSSSVYASSANKLKETSDLGPQSPYGQTKMMMEQVLADIAAAESNLHVAVFRYFNVAGAHDSGLLGENFLKQNNIFSSLMRVMHQIDRELTIHGNHFSTPDGFAIRDFIHVSDLVAAHLAIIPKLPSMHYELINLGSGEGVSLLQLIRMYEAIGQRPIPYRVVDRGKGNTGYSVAQITKAKRTLNWQNIYSLQDICQSHLQFATRAFAEKWL